MIVEFFTVFFCLCFVPVFSEVFLQRLGVAPLVGWSSRLAQHLQPIYPSASLVFSPLADRMFLLFAVVFTAKQLEVFLSWNFVWTACLISEISSTSATRQTRLWIHLCLHLSTKRPEPLLHHLIHHDLPFHLHKPINSFKPFLFLVKPTYCNKKRKINWRRGTLTNFFLGVVQKIVLSYMVFISSCIRNAVL